MHTIAAIALALALTFSPPAHVLLQVDSAIEQVVDDAQNAVDSVQEGVDGAIGEPSPAAPPAAPPVAPPPLMPAPPGPVPAPQVPGPQPAIPRPQENTLPPEFDGSGPVLPTATETPAIPEPGVDIPVERSTLERALLFVGALVLVVVVGVTALYYWGKERGSRLTRRRVLGKVKQLEELLK